MSLFARSVTKEDLLSYRTSVRTSRSQIPASSALKHSVVWACQHLRADLISTMPADGFRKLSGIDVPISLPKFFAAPNDQIDFQEWMYDTQVDLDSGGNTVGLITARDALGNPAQIELLPSHEMAFTIKGSRITEYRVGGEVFKGADLANIWHERQFTRSGFPLGLSPIAHAALSVGTYLSAQEFASMWYGQSGIPTAHLKNTAREVTRDQAVAMKARFKETVAAGDVFVSGNDWTYEPIAAKASEAAFIEAMESTGPEICRFFGVPGDMVDVPVNGSSITYANVTQRNLQLLILNINPALRRRENTLSTKLLPQPRTVKFNRGALLEMDLEARYTSYAIAVENRFMTPDEVRALENRPPLTSAQISEFFTLFPPKLTSPTTTPTTPSKEA